MVQDVRADGGLYWDSHVVGILDHPNDSATSLASFELLVGDDVSGN